MQMNIIQPSRITFWRFIFAVSAAICFFSIYQLIGRAQTLGVDFSASTSWMGLLAGLGLMGLLALLLAVTWSRFHERLLGPMEFPERASNEARWIGALLFGLALVGFSGAFMIPFLQNNFGGIGGMRILIFWSFSLGGMWGIKLFRRETSWFLAWVATILCQTTFHLLLLYWPRVTDYPFALGWAETSRFYYPSLFLSENVYGQQYPWPILHPTLHLLLTPPYLFDAPLWVHRAWLIVMGYLILGAVVPVLLKRLSIQGRATRGLVGLWIFLFLFTGPLYFHLAVPLIIVLLGFSSGNDRRTWIVVLLASIWCGWSRVNWYPMPGMIVAVLYLMEVPYREKNIWNYLRKPVLCFVIGILTAFVAQRVYIFLSGVPNSSVFYTSLSSDLLWYRLWPNSSFFLGVLPGALIVSLPIWIVMGIVIRARRQDWHPLRLALILSALFILFVGGLIVSLKIGGGANVHNMDAYLSMLLIVFGYLIFAAYRTEAGETGRPVALHWSLIVLLLIQPVWSFIQFSIGFGTYDFTRTQSVLSSLQGYVDQVNAQGGEILFITQRHLISMHLLTGVTLVPEYEREDLMEIAMANNELALKEFRDDMESQRFALIIVDPLNDNLLSRRRGFSEENNVWVTQIVRPILCNYRTEVSFPADDITLYVPQEGPRQCR